MRWWDELRTPALKCARLGHNMRNVEVHVYLRPENRWRSVADEATETTPTCSRCGHKEETTVDRYRSLTGLTLPSHRMREFEKNGRLVQ